MITSTSNVRSTSKPTNYSHAKTTSRSTERLDAIQRPINRKALDVLRHAYLICNSSKGSMKLIHAMRYVRSW